MRTTDERPHFDNLDRVRIVRTTPVVLPEVRR